MRFKSLFLLVAFFSFLVSNAQPIDVQHYVFHIELSDESNVIKGSADITLKLLKPTSQFELDLVQPTANGTGMKVSAVKGAGVTSFTQANNKVVVLLDGRNGDSIIHIQVAYSGVPDNGLIISKNQYGDRTFFADNWPNRARYWLPCNDAPSDKASVEFIVTAPSKYKVISNGLLTEESPTQNGKSITHYKEMIPIPTKVMVIGAANFAVSTLDTVQGCLPISAWVYPQDKEKGFYDYKLASGIVNYFSDYIAPFPFKKLANVQSKTIFGGMENASAIFYAERTVTGDRSSEDLVAHEIAHQWFGDMATEKSFAHLWLSEGFATYMTDVYLQHVYGNDFFKKRLAEEREQVVQFAEKHRKPVVDSISPLMELLNANSYQKGAWVLHMLRQQVGDAVFQNIIRQYYQQYKGANANTQDFIAVAEKTSGKELRSFFTQWLYKPGVPDIKVWWGVKRGTLMEITVEQKNEEPFTFPLDIEITYASGNKKRITLPIHAKQSTISFTVSEPVKEVTLDPEIKLLYTGTIKEKS